MPQSSYPDQLTLENELIDAFERLSDSTCADMAPLWLAATRSAREGLLEQATWTEPPTDRYLRMAPASKSKYRALAAWRHAVMWREAHRLANLDQPDREVVDAIYFTPAPNSAPYSWSRSAADCPALPRGANPSWVKERASEVAGELLGALIQEHGRFHGLPNNWDQTAARILAVATRPTLDDVLKLERKT